MTQPQSRIINVSTSAVFRVIAVLVGLIFLYLIRDIVMMVFVSVVVAAAVSGPVNWLQKRKVPRLLGVVFIYLIILLLISFVFSLVLPPLTVQIKQLANHFPEMMEKIGLSINQWWGQYKIESSLQTIISQVGLRLTQATSGFFATIINLFGGLFSTIVVLVISFYLALQEKGVKTFLLSLTPEPHKAYASSLIERIQSKIGGWMRGQLLLMLIIGILTYIGLLFLGVKYALLLALIAGFLEIIPYIGPIIATIPGVILAFIQSPFLALFVLLLYIIIQQLENYVITPQVMKKAVGLNPITIIIVMLIGAKLAGVLGIILSVPLAAAGAEVLKDMKFNG